jgi:predicted peptidase
MPQTDLLTARMFRACTPSLATLAFVCTALLTGCGGSTITAGANTPTAPGSSVPTPNGAASSGMPVMYYNSFVPDTYAREPDKRFPLIISLHGAGGLIPADDLIDVHAIHAKGFGFIVVSPSSDGRAWSVTRLEKFYADVIARYRVDPERVYLTGLSMGSYGAWDFAKAYPKRFAAMALISGGGNGGSNCALKDLPIWLFHNGADPVVPLSVSVATADSLRACGATPKQTIYDALPAGMWEHNAWQAAWTTPQLYEWFLSHRRAPSA